MDLFILLILVIANHCGFIASAEKPACPTYPIEFFVQKLDHADNSSTTTFQQRYQLDTSRFKPGGPILFYQGAESTEFFCIEGVHFSDMAEDLGAALVAIEHRFFGGSFPAGVGADNATKEDFLPLTMENVVADSVALVQWVKNTVPGAQNSRVIVNGGSYGASVATVDRLWYPEVFYAAWASAPQLRSFGPDLDANDDKYGFWDWVSSTVAEYRPTRLG